MSIREANFNKQALILIILEPLVLKFALFPNNTMKKETVNHYVQFYVFR